MPKLNKKNVIVMAIIIVMAMVLTSACAAAEKPTYTWVSTTLFGTEGDLDPYKSADYYLGHFMPDDVELRTDSFTYVLEEYEPEHPEEGYAYLKFTEFKGNKADEEITEECILKYKPTASAGPYLRYNARLQTIEPCCFEKIE